MKESPKYGKKISLSELKVIQMDILSAIDEFCNANNIMYSMACGTLLGAIRHSGYIPWDDDIDIYILREDYNKLVRKFPKVYKNRYMISSLERDKNWEKPFAKAYDLNTVLIEDSSAKDNIGVNIDIFPIDDVPMGKEWLKYDKKRRFLQKLFTLRLVRPNDKRSFIKNSILVILKCLTSFYSLRLWAKKLDSLAQKYNNKNLQYCFETCQGLQQKRPFPKKIFEDLVYLPFEDRQFKAFAEYDIYLKNGFGNYMELPPESKRISHHSFKAYWK